MFVKLAPGNKVFIPNMSAVAAAIPAGPLKHARSFTSIVCTGLRRPDCQVVLLMLLFPVEEDEDKLKNAEVL
jgi:hypothetical protein